MDYTATVSDQYTAKFYLTATTPAYTNEEIAIDGKAVKSGEPYELDLKEGETKFTIIVHSDEATSATYHLTVNRRTCRRFIRQRSWRPASGASTTLVERAAMKASISLKARIAP